MPRLFEEFPQTAQRLMIAAERLYGQHGVEGVSLRQIVAGAGQSNNNAVPLYFGSKLGLIQAVLEMRLPALETERRRLLDLADMDQDHGGRRMLGALLMPLATVLSEQDLEHYARFILAVIRFENDFRSFTRSPDITPASIEIDRRLAEAFPALPPDVFKRRLLLACELFLNAAAQFGGKLRLSADGYPTRQLFFQDIFGAAVAVLSAPFPPAAQDGSSADTETERPIGRSVTRRKASVAE